MIRVVIADDQPLVRAGLRALLERAQDITVVGEACDGAEAIAVVRAERPDVILMDIRMPGMDGIEAARHIATDDTRVIMLTTFDVDEHVFDSIRAGAAGFLLKNAQPEELRHAVRVVASGHALLSPAVTGRVMRAVADAPGRARQRPELLANLTEREREVLTHVGRGCSNTEIAAALHISAATARTYVSRLLTKLAARDRSQLVVLAYRGGLITDPP